MRKSQEIGKVRVSGKRRKEEERKGKEVSGRENEAGSFLKYIKGYGY